GQPASYLSPFIQFLREGAADGSLIIREDVVDQAEVTWNAVAWTYTHLRGRHRWGAGRARRLIFDLLMSGLGGEAKEEATCPCRTTSHWCCASLARESSRSRQGAAKWAVSHAGSVLGKARRPCGLMRTGHCILRSVAACPHRLAGEPGARRLVLRPTRRGGSRFRQGRRPGRACCPQPQWCGAGPPLPLGRRRGAFPRLVPSPAPGNARSTRDDAPDLGGRSTQRARRGDKGGCGAGGRG